ncbi:hypothetical protein QFC19_000302 [Naganishia cerealis]|uniref:Uncharacterized protein n=1 Tax=Naganishia cerealis TaxID=610337 RepID=A0ACC2WPJ1_9TREE|nr:hypothetical protein QFC19_000302 [Naganishia cerealis]
MAHHLKYPDIGSWGIDDALSTTSSATKYNSPYIHGPGGVSGYFPPHQKHDFKYYFHRYNQVDVSPSTELFSRFIKKYLSTHNLTGEFWERFKYQLILSNLMDDSLILSKNEQALNTLMANTKEPTATRLTRLLNFDGTELFVVKKYYLIRFPEKYYNTQMVLQVIHLIIFLIKQSLKEDSHLLSHSKHKLFRILLVVSTRMIQFKRIGLRIKANKILNYTEEFLKLNYKINKKLISHMIRAKEMAIFTGTSLSSSGSNDPTSLMKTLDETLSFLIFNLKSSIVRLLPFLNGPTFEQYCHINNINIDILGKSLDETELTIDTLRSKLDKFHKLRKMFLCQLLTISERQSYNFFLSKAWDLFNLPQAETRELCSTPISVLEKFIILEDIFHEHNQTVSNFNNLVDRYERLNPSATKTRELENSDVLQVDNHQTGIPETNMDSLIQKLTNLTTNFGFFKKYNQSVSTIDNIDELNEKIMIFQQLGEELQQSMQLYQLTLSDLNHDLYMKTGYGDIEKTPSSSTSTSRRSSRNCEEFSPKTFHTTSSSLKKRFSLPSQATGKPNQSPTIDSQSSSLKSKVGDKLDKKYKRLSTGLQLGLLTVFEEPNKASSFSVNRNNRAAYDDNYINILPSNNYYEGYNQAALESLSNLRVRNSRLSINRFSLNSLASNVSSLSDLVSSTQITSFADDDDNKKSTGLSKEDLRNKLEESFARIYNLENENKTLKETSQSNDSDKLDAAEVTAQSFSPSFLGELENTITQKISTEDQLV